LKLTYEEVLEMFRSTLESKIREHNKKQGFSVDIKIEINKGRKFDKIVRVDSGRSVYCFVDRASGGILKGNWKTVEDHRERGNIYNDDPLQGCGPYGPAYLIKSLNTTSTW